MGLSSEDRTAAAAAEDGPAGGATDAEAGGATDAEVNDEVSITFECGPESTPRLRAIADYVATLHADGAPTAAPLIEFARLIRLDTTPACRELTRTERMRSLAIIFGLGSLSREHLIEEFRLMREGGRPVAPRPTDFVEFVTYMSCLVDNHLEFLVDTSRRTFGWVSLHRLAEQHALGETTAAEFAAESIRVLNIRNDFEAVVEACASPENEDAHAV